MPVSFVVDVTKMNREVKEDLSKYGNIRFELQTGNAYVLEFIPQGNTHKEIVQSYENFISELKNKKYVKKVTECRPVSTFGFD
jgi:uncharacterized protein YlbG (UPF0298 family)